MKKKGMRITMSAINTCSILNIIVMVVMSTELGIRCLLLIIEHA